MRSTSRRRSARASTLPPATKWAAILRAAQGTCLPPIVTRSVWAWIRPPRGPSSRSTRFLVTTPFRSGGSRRWCPLARRFSRSTSRPRWATTRSPIPRFPPRSSSLPMREPGTSPPPRSPGVSMFRTSVRFPASIPMKSTRSCSAAAPMRCATTSITRRPWPPPTLPSPSSCSRTPRRSTDARRCAPGKCCVKWMKPGMPPTSASSTPSPPVRSCRHRCRCPCSPCRSTLPPKK